MSGEDLVIAASGRNQEEVARLTNEGGVNVNSQDQVSFSSFSILVYLLNSLYKHTFYDNCLTLYVSYVYDGLMIYE